MEESNQYYILNEKGEYFVRNDFNGKAYFLAPYVELCLMFQPVTLELLLGIHSEPYKTTLDLPTQLNNRILLNVSAVNRFLLFRLSLYCSVIQIKRFVVSG